ncbi:MAG: serine/threonine protein kinase [Anaerolineae bacterium]|nr:MAG: serine/threonine protein kinase [Anaerolineae bacterium]
MHSFPNGDTIIFMDDKQTFGRYTIREELGRGGMATVYLADDPSFDRVVAIKVLPREYLHDPLFRARFEREAKTIAKLEHAAIVPVYDYGEQDGQLYLVMRYMQGGSLAQRLERGPITPDETATIIRRLASALDKAHGQGIVHRDLKPGNILFDEDGQAYLADFGIARWVEATNNLTGGMLVGTPAYMSPEQVQGDQPVDGRSDQYSLAIIVFEMLTGEKPYEADTPAKVLMKHILEPVPNLEATQRGLPAPLGPALTRALAKKPEDRFSDTGEFAKSLATGLTDRLALDTPAPATAKPADVPMNLTPAAAQTVPAPRRPPLPEPTPASTPHPSAGVTTGATKPKGNRGPRTLIIIGLLGGACLLVAIATGGLAWLTGLPALGFSAPTPTATLRPSPTPEPVFTGDLARLVPSLDLLPGGMQLDTTGATTNTQVGEIYFQRDNAANLFSSSAEIAQRLDEIGRQTSYYANFVDPAGCDSASAFTSTGVVLIQHRDNAAAIAHTEFARTLVIDYWALAQPYTTLGDLGDITYNDDEQYCDRGVTIQFVIRNLLVVVYVNADRARLDLATIQLEAERVANIVIYNLAQALTP